MDNRQFDALMQTAQKAFLDELVSKIDEIEKLITSCGGKCSEHDSQNILRFFHSVNGTAATLGLSHLASIGREWEVKIKKLLEKGRGLDVVILKDIHSQITEVKKSIGYMEEKETGGTHTHPGNDYINMPARGKVLLVDDDVSILKLLENALTIEEYSVYICDDSASAMDLIEITRPDIIMLDIMMPEINGYELLEQIRTKPEYSDINVIFLSGMNNIEEKIKGMKSGADDYITKPFIIDEVIARVETVLRRSNKFKVKLLRDDLTGSYSRYYFNQRILEEVERYKRNGVEFSIAFVDMDHYKVINDKFGHQTGDFVLKELVSYLNQNIRGCDSLYRFGGEEFIILLPHTPESKAYTVINRLRKGFSRKTISVAGTTIKATFSAGITQISSKETTVEQLISTADKAMYHAKNLGRNRIVVYNREMSIKDYRRTLLLVDDENIILKLLADRLSSIGYDIITAKDGKSAIALTGEAHPDAVILDLILPDIDGFEVCRQIKGNAATCTTKVIMLSKMKQKKNIAKGLYSGADDYLTKPFSMIELEARIMRLLNNCCI